MTPRLPSNTPAGQAVDTLNQGPVRSLRDEDMIVLRQSNGREMFLPVGVLVDYVAVAIAHAVGTARIPAERVDGLATVATTGDYKDLRGKPSDPPGHGN